MKSTVKWFENEKGYGYIECKGNDILIHYCAFREQGQDEIVEIELIKTDTCYEIKDKVSIEKVA